MAIIKCPECNHEVSDQARSCPFCGVDIAGNILLCPDCGKILLKTARVCPNCQCNLSSVRPVPSPVVDDRPQPERRQPRRPRIKEKKESGKGLWVIFSLVFIVLMGVGGYYYLKQRQHTQAMEAAYAALTENYDIDAHSQFLKDYPASPYGQAIAEKMDELRSVEKEWTAVALADSKEKYENFLKQHPKSFFTQTCTAKLDSIDWVEASTENTQESYQRYLSLHKQGKYAKLAAQTKAELDKLAVSSNEKAIVRSVIYRYFDAVSAHDNETLQTIASERMRGEAQGLMGAAGSTHYTIVTAIGVTKAPSSVQDVYNFVAKFKVEKRTMAGGATNVELYNGSSVITPDNRVVALRLTPAESVEGY